MKNNKMFLKLKVSYPPICENGETRVSIRRYCRFFLRSFDAHFFVAVLPFLAFLHRKFPPYFFAGIRACANMRFRPNTSVGNADRSISRRSARTLNNAGDRDVLRQNRYENA